ncbi:NAD-dependent epimerase/dehydratase family protein, partial [Cobetia sp. Dlab-2-U]|nr:NAD-dependent epimerase/dehydratase family protein [Cobetia sp. Dlab-2-U]
GIDNYSPYYDPDLKHARSRILSADPGFRVHAVSVDEAGQLQEVWEQERPDIVIHLAAQAGVRHSIDHPETYIRSNLVGTYNVLEMCRQYQITHLLAASTSSVYGANTTYPFSEQHQTATPMSLYAATKGANELVGHSYSHLFNIPMTFFRFFTVYGEWGRPDMALFKFTRSILSGEPIDIYNNGKMRRDFTYIGDLVESVVRLAVTPPVPGGQYTASTVAPYRIVNIGKGSTDDLMSLVSEVEKATGRRAIRNFLPMQPGDVPETHADVSVLEAVTGYRPDTPLCVGIPAFVSWYRAYYGLD